MKHCNYYTFSFVVERFSRQSVGRCKYCNFVTENLPGQLEEKTLEKFVLILCGNTHHRIPPLTSLQSKNKHTSNMVKGGGCWNLKGRQNFPTEKKEAFLNNFKFNNYWYYCWKILSLCSQVSHSYLNEFLFHLFRLNTVLDARHPSFTCWFTILHELEIAAFLLFIVPIILYICCLQLHPLEMLQLYRVIEGRWHIRR